MKIRELVYRYALPHFLNANGLVGEGAEIGTYQGDYAELILTHWRGKKLHCIDPWRDFPDEVYCDGSNFNWGTDGKKGARVDWEEMFQKVKARLAPFPAANLIRKTSEEAAPMFRDGQLDFAYVDANHDKAREDIELWWPKVKSGGILGGHDAYDRHDDLQRCSVWSAVWDFAHKIGQKPHLTFCTSWYFLKP